MNPRVFSHRSALGGRNRLPSTPNYRTPSHGRRQARQAGVSTVSSNTLAIELERPETGCANIRPGLTLNRTEVDWRAAMQSSCESSRECGGLCDLHASPQHFLRLWGKVVKTDTCWLWRGAVDRRTGYGRFRVNGSNAYAHRVVYQEAFGSIPSGMHIDHICRVRLCVRPSHLQAVTPKQNSENLPVRRDSTSGVRGVFWYPRYRKWVAKVRHNGRLYHVGYFQDLDEAEAAVIAKRRDLFTNSVMDGQVSG